MKKMFDGGEMIFAVNWLIGILPKLDAGKKYAVEVKQHREKRSLNANNYAWQLIDQIAEETKLPPDEIYHRLLVDWGTAKMRNGEVYTVSIPAKIELTLECDKYLYIHTAFIGEGTVNGKMFNHYRVIKGSSEYDTKEMSRFIDGVVQEAQRLKIETRTPEEIALLKSRGVA